MINTLQKKILNEDSNYNRGYSSSINDVQKKNNKNGLASFNTVNVNFGQRTKDFGSSISKKTDAFLHMPSVQESTQENSGMAKFFAKIKNNLDRTLSKNDRHSEQNIINEEKSSSSSDEDNEDNGNSR